MKNLYVMVGCPGSGKSYYAENTMLKFLDNGTYVSRDEVRFTMIKRKDEYFSHENEVFKKYIERINDGLAKGNDVIADATHLNAASRWKLLKNTKGMNKVIAIVLKTPLDTCLERNSHRSGLYKVPETALRNMYNSITMPNFDSEEIDEIYIVTPDKRVEHIIKEEE